MAAVDTDERGLLTVVLLHFLFFIVWIVLHNRNNGGGGVVSTLSYLFSHKSKMIACILTTSDIHEDICKQDVSEEGEAIENKKLSLK